MLALPLPLQLLCTAATAAAAAAAAAAATTAAVTDEPSWTVLPVLQQLGNCSVAVPCVYPGHDCSGHDIFDVGRQKAYTMPACTALCVATNGCEGFVFDAIPSEEKGQCHVANLPPGQGCCLMKTPRGC